MKKRLSYRKKVFRTICVRYITFLAARPLSYVIFCRFFRLLPHRHLLQFYVKEKILLQKMVGAGGRWACAPCPPVSTAIMMVPVVSLNIMVNECVVGCCFNYEETTVPSFSSPAKHEDLKNKRIRFVKGQKPSLTILVVYISHSKEKLVYW